MQSSLSKTFVFPKIAWSGSRKINQPEIEVKLTMKDNGKLALSICGNIWNAHHTDIICVDNA